MYVVIKHNDKKNSHEPFPNCEVLKYVRVLLLFPLPPPISSVLVFIIPSL